MVSEMFDYKQAAEFLGVKITTLYSMVSRREVPHTRIGRRIVRFPREQLVTWVSARTVLPQKPLACEGVTP